MIKNLFTINILLTSIYIYTHLHIKQINFNDYDHYHNYNDILSILWPTEKLTLHNEHSSSSTENWGASGKYERNRTQISCGTSRLHNESEDSWP